MTTDSDNISVTHKDLNVLLADGTGYKKFVSIKKQEQKNKLLEKTGQQPIEESKRGEVRIMMGIDKENNIIPIRAWTVESWKVIGRFINKANNSLPFGTAI
ncbi:MAG: hypothetical protein A2451_04410 [Bdellovibrionales bacterium RIFOXYC2_FULL_39_8]|nr:MAG: hypothetical protein A2451_04410 [Bdellovibrionales bacterium RIFOXYC2_FULL_39_8]